MSRRARVALLLIVVAALLRGLVWAAALPPWQGPDEQSHYAYVERLANGGYPPADNQQVPSKALDQSVLATGYIHFRERSAQRPFTDALRAQLPDEPPDLPDDGRGAFGASSYPPVYYAALVPLYLLPVADTATERLMALRVGSALFGAALVALTFLLVRELVRDDLLALGAAALLSLAPLVSQASAICNPDIALAVFASGLALACVRLQRRGPTRRRLVAIAALGLLTAYTKPAGPVTAAIIVAGLAVLPLVLARVRLRLPLLALGAVAAAGAFFVGATRIYALEPFDHVRYALSYLWQFYLPPLPFLQQVFTPGPLTDPIPWWAIWVRTGVGYFGWISVPLPTVVYVVGALSLGGALLVATAAAVRHRAEALSRFDWLLPAAAFTVVLYLLMLHAAEVALMILYNGGERLLHARYLLPVVPLALAAAVAALSLLSRRAAYTVLGSLLVVWFGISFAGLAVVLRFFGT